MIVQVCVNSNEYGQQSDRKSVSPEYQSFKHSEPGHPGGLTLGICGTHWDQCNISYTSLNSVTPVEQTKVTFGARWCSSIFSFTEQFGGTQGDTNQTSRVYAVWG